MQHRPPSCPECSKELRYGSHCRKGEDELPTAPGVMPHMENVAINRPRNVAGNPILHKWSFSQRRLPMFCWFCETFIICHYAV